MGNRSSGGSRFTVPGELTDLNRYIQAERGNRYAASNIKKKETARCAAACRHVAPVSAQVVVRFTWYTRNTRKDPDNVAHAKKYVLDGMVASGVLPQDSRKHICGLVDDFQVDADNPRVEVFIVEAGRA